ncbi:hypothetical protein ST47_g8447 [Ascochyta rabiei]|uniref:LysM domain-containing protein n=1 Tax=Didymella rabiei TaxID=5454 RepID=A0A162YY33_DIDRA|nr:hypothetical protein ST47_g8447 [Ascochyta rabiei]
MAFTLATGARFPLAPGTVPSCNQYRNHFTKAVPAIANQEVIDIKASPIYQPQNDCCWIAQKHGSTLENLLQWNPSLNSEDCELQPGYGYCVSKTKGSESRIAARHGTCLPNDALKYTEIMAGTDPNCDCFAMVISEERRDDDRLTCSRLVETANLPIENIIKYNSWISKADCDGSLCGSEFDINQAADLYF